MDYQNMTVQALRTEANQRNIGTGGQRAVASKAALITALTWADGVTMNGKPEEFSVAGVTLVDQMRAALEAVDRADTYVHERGAALAMVRAVLKGGAV